MGIATDAPGAEPGRSRLRISTSAITDLRRDHQTFHWTQETQAQNRPERQPDDKVDPDRWVIGDLGHERAEDNDEAYDHNDEDCGPISAIDLREIIAAGGAQRLEVKKPGEKATFSAMGTQSAQARPERIQGAARRQCPQPDPKIT